MKDIKLILQEIEKHIDTLDYETKKLKELNLTPEDLDDYENIVLLDAFIFRFIKLQSALREKLFPLFFEILTGKSYTEATFIDILNTLEKYGFLENAEEWNKIRKLRNEFVHIYPWETDIKLEAVKSAIGKLNYIKKTFFKIRNYLNAKGI
ncbi:hypothetical protein [Persephonella sp. KM09-Lau-8]|uniref:hypothetical protein n=1 Tax=Persephonella sp. KM09-Lau-8 TaxID=1158345 RepID=UPI00068CF85D|nr:hypothetical protein [Persephonella sp. KM09-Lau-8]